MVAPQTVQTMTQLNDSQNNSMPLDGSILPNESIIIKEIVNFDIEKSVKNT